MVVYRRSRTWRSVPRGSLLIGLGVCLFPEQWAFIGVRAVSPSLRRRSISAISGQQFHFLRGRWRPTTRALVTHPGGKDRSSALQVLVGLAHNGFPKQSNVYVHAQEALCSSPGARAPTDRVHTRARWFMRLGRQKGKRSLTNSRNAVTGYTTLSQVGRAFEVCCLCSNR